jgi:hypothetical protein
LSPLAKALLLVVSLAAVIAAVAYGLQPRHVVVITRAPD